MDNGNYMDHLDKQALIAAMGSPEHSTDDLDLTTLPDRLDDGLLARVKAISSSPLPPPIPCSDAHFSKILRTMLAVLPRRVSDDVGGELFVAAYQHKLGHLPQEAINYIADKALGECKWFPTIAECLELLVGWRRWDSHAQRKQAATSLANHETTLRRREQDNWRHKDGTPWKPDPAELARIKDEVTASLRP